MLEEAAKASVEQLTNEIKTLELRIKGLKKETQLPNTPSDIKEQMGDFLQVHMCFLSKIRIGNFLVGFGRKHKMPYTKILGIACSTKASIAPIESMFEHLNLEIVFDNRSIGLSIGVYCDQEVPQNT